MKRNERNDYNYIRKTVVSDTINVDIPVTYTKEARQAMHDLLTIEKSMHATVIEWNDIRKEYCIGYAPGRRQEQENADIDVIMSGLRKTDYTWNGYKKPEETTTNNNDEKEMEETTMKTTTTNKTGYDVSKLTDAMRIREASGEVTFHAPRGNDKTGIIPCWNLLPVVTCKGLCPGCYALKNAFRCGYDVNKSSVLKAWTDNTILAKTDIEGLYEKLDEYFSSMAAPRYFRIHASGDFFSKAYAYMWFRIAQNHPETRFLAFTKQFDNVRGIPFCKLDNFSLVLSAWPGKPIPEDLTELYSVAWMQDGTEDRIPEKVFECPGNCQTCGACWTLSKEGRDVCFHKH